MTSGVLLGVLQVKTPSNVHAIIVEIVTIISNLYSHEISDKIIAMTKGVLHVVVNANNKEKLIVEDLLSLADDSNRDFENIVNGDYAEIVKVLGVEVALKMYIHFRGCNISFPKHFYKPDYVVTVASKCPDKREREKIAIVCGYTSQWIERRIRELRIEIASI